MKLTVLYDAECGLCRLCRDWMRRRRALIPMEFLALQSPQVDERFPEIRRFEPERALVAIDDRGCVYQGERAWIACLSVLKGWRTIARGLGSPMMMPLTRGVYRMVAKNRHRISRWIGTDCGGSCNV